MKTTKYEYASQIRIGDLNPDILNWDNKKLAKLFTEQIEKGIETAYDPLKPKDVGWKIFSHSVMVLGNRLVISFLLRRPIIEK